MSTGFKLWLDDRNNYAHNQGVNSAIITGPGLPNGGVIFGSNSTQTNFYMYGGNGDYMYPIADDTVLNAIPDRVVYTVKLYAETADAVSVGNAPLRTFSRTIAKRPYLKTELSAALFPTAIVPASHDVSTMNIPGLQTVSWTNPTEVTVNGAMIGWWDGSNDNYVDSEHLLPSTTSVQVDTSSFSVPQVNNGNGRIQESKKGTDLFFDSPPPVW
ncbi:MAG: hypothetical protein FP815_11645 [Desulfobulbaceae bacterium]|nr:hypothetical protein [Desulfobulbaceae bacterium]